MIKPIMSFLTQGRILAGRAVGRWVSASLLQSVREAGPSAITPILGNAPTA